MANRPEDTRPSVITSILGAVGRELQQFVLNAAGVSAVGCSLLPESCVNLAQSLHQRLQRQTNRRPSPGNGDIMR